MYNCPPYSEPKIQVYNLCCFFLKALSRITKHNSGVFQNVIEKVGLPKMLTTMAIPVNRIQQAILTMFASLITSEVRLTRLLQEKVRFDIPGYVLVTM